MKRIIFADLDGTLIETKSGKTFPINYKDWKPKEGVLESLQTYKPTVLHIVTNQGGIENGTVNKDDFKKKIMAINRFLKKGLPETKITYAVCTSNDKSNPNRKPNTGMIDKYVNKTKCDKQHCLMIGDASGKAGQFSDSDKKCAENARIKYMDINDFIKKYYNNEIDNI